MNRLDLHPLFDPSRPSIQFWVRVAQRTLHLELSKETLSHHFPVPDTHYGLMMTYDAHRDQIDAAVMRRAALGGSGTLDVRSADFHG